MKNMITCELKNDRRFKFLNLVSETFTEKSPIEEKKNIFFKGYDDKI